MVQLRESESLPLFPKTAVLYIFVLSQLCGFAFGTYSIVGADRDTYLIGGAAASCVPGSDLGQIIYHGQPGFGVLHTQAVPLEKESAAVVTALEQIGELIPATILENMNKLDSGTENSVTYGFPGLEGEYLDYDFRQNAIVDLGSLDEAHAAWTGAAIAPLYVAIGFNGTTQEDRGGVVNNRYTYSAQGNFVTKNTVSALESGFSGCDLPDMLMNALLNVSDSGNGDMRCLRADFLPTEISGIPAAGGFLKVQSDQGNYIIDLNVVGDGTVDPTIELKQRYNEWRAENPCPPAGSPEQITGTAETTGTMNEESSGGLGIFAFSARAFAGIFLAVMSLY